MKAPNAILSSLFAAMAAFCHADEPPTGTNPPPVSATASWGAGLSIAQPVGLLFTPAAYSPNWKFRGAFGGTRLATTNGCSRAFMIDLSGNTGENIADGGSLRFCGVNLVHGANTPSTPEDAERFAANLARMGFNSVRIHHHERPIVRRGDPAVLAFNTNALDRFDALVAACVRHGLYITTDLFVSRAPIAWRAVGIDKDGTMRSGRAASSPMSAVVDGKFQNALARRALK